MRNGVVGLDVESFDPLSLVAAAAIEAVRVAAAAAARSPTPTQRDRVDQPASKPRVTSAIASGCHTPRASRRPLANGGCHTPRGTSRGYLDIGAPHANVSFTPAPGLPRRMYDKPWLVSNASVQRGTSCSDEARGRAAEACASVMAAPLRSGSRESMCAGQRGRTASPVQRRKDRGTSPPKVSGRYSPPVSPRLSTRSTGSASDAFPSSLRSPGSKGSASDAFPSSLRSPRSGSGGTGVAHQRVVGGSRSQTKAATAGETGTVTATAIAAAISNGGPGLVPGSKAVAAATRKTSGNMSAAMRSRFTSVATVTSVARAASGAVTSGGSSSSTARATKKPTDDKSKSAPDSTQKTTANDAKKTTDDKSKSAPDSTQKTIPDDAKAEDNDLPTEMLSPMESQETPREAILRRKREAADREIIRMTKATISHVAGQPIRQRPAPDSAFGVCNSSLQADDDQDDDDEEPLETPAQAVRRRKHEASDRDAERLRGLQVEPVFQKPCARPISETCFPAEALLTWTPQTVVGESPRQAASRRQNEVRSPAPLIHGETPREAARRRKREAADRELARVKVEHAEVSGTAREIASRVRDAQSRSCLGPVLTPCATADFGYPDMVTVDSDEDYGEGIEVDADEMLPAHSVLTPCQDSDLLAMYCQATQAAR